jgi:hypothetical protein
MGKRLKSQHRNESRTSHPHSCFDRRGLQVKSSLKRIEYFTDYGPLSTKTDVTLNCLVTVLLHMHVPT